MELKESVTQPPEWVNLGQDLQQALRERWLQAQPLQIRCATRAESLLVLAEHLLHIEPDPEQTFSSLELAIGELVPEVLASGDASLQLLQELPVQLFLRIAGYQHPYASRTFRLELRQSPSVVAAPFTEERTQETTVEPLTASSSVPAIDPVEASPEIETVEEPIVISPTIEAVLPETEIAETNIPLESVETADPTPVSDPTESIAPSREDIEPAVELVETEIIETVEPNSVESISAESDLTEALQVQEELVEAADLEDTGVLRNVEEVCSAESELTELAALEISADEVTADGSVEDKTAEADELGEVPKSEPEGAALEGLPVERFDGTRIEAANLAETSPENSISEPNLIEQTEVVEENTIALTNLAQLSAVEDEQVQLIDQVAADVIDQPEPPPAAISDVEIEVEEPTGEATVEPGNSAVQETSEVAEVTESEVDEEFISPTILDQDPLAADLNQSVNAIERELSDSALITDDVLLISAPDVSDDRAESELSDLTEATADDIGQSEITSLESLDTVPGNQSIEVTGNLTGEAEVDSLETDLSTDFAPEVDSSENQFVEVSTFNQNFADTSQIEAYSSITDETVEPSDQIVREDTPDIRPETAAPLLPTESHLNSSSSITADPNQSLIQAVKAATVQSKQRNRTRNAHPAVLPAKTTPAVAQASEFPSQPRRFQWSASSVALGGAIGSFVLVSGLYLLTRPCVIGGCEPLQRARQLSQEAIQTAQTTESALEVVEAHKQLNEASYLLGTIPAWSRHHESAQAVLASYEDQAVVLGQVVEALEQANGAAQRSQNPPHPLHEWREIQRLWREVIARLERIPSDSPLQSLVQRKLQEYQANLTGINQRVAIEQQAQDRIAVARQAGQIAEARAGAAQSAKNWQETAATWTTAIEQLRQVPQGTIGHDEAQQLLAIYQPKLTEARSRQTQESTAADAYSQALSAAEQARKLEQQNQWAQAATRWRDALTYVQQVPNDSAYYGQVQPLISTYTKTLQQAQDNSQRATAIESARSNLDLACSGNPRICTYTLSPQIVRVQFTPGYDQTVGKLITNADSKGSGFPPETVNQVNGLLRTLAEISDATQVPIELFDSNGTKLGTYTPSLSGYVLQQ